MRASASRRVTVAEYLALEEGSAEKHEFYEGEILAMAGGSPEHALLSMNVGAELRLALRGKPCLAFSSDLRVRIPETGLITYPDVSVVCGPLERDPEDRNALTNPTLLVEVLSPSTASYDRGQKLDHYLRLPSVREVLLVDSERVHIDRYRRIDDRSWERMGFGPGERLPLSSLGLELEVDALYAGWEAPAAP